MNTQRHYTDYLQDMLDACLKAALFTKDMSFDEFSRDEKTQYAII